MWTLGVGGGRKNIVGAGNGSAQPGLRRSGTTQRPRQAIQFYAFTKLILEVNFGNWHFLSAKDICLKLKIKIYRKTKRFVNRKETGHSQRDIFEEFKCCLLFVKIMHKMVQKYILMRPYNNKTLWSYTHVVISLKKSIII